MLIYNHPANELQLTDRRLIEIFGAAQCEKWKKESPVMLDYQAFELVNGHLITPLAECGSNTEMEQLESLDPVNFPVDELLEERPSFINPNRYHIKRSFLERKYYRIGHTDQVLVLLSGKELKEMFGM